MSATKPFKSFPALILTLSLCGALAHAEPKPPKGYHYETCDATEEATTNYYGWTVQSDVAETAADQAVASCMSQGCDDCKVSFKRGWPVREYLATYRGRARATGKKIAPDSESSSKD